MKKNLLASALMLLGAAVGVNMIATSDNYSGV